MVYGQGYTRRYTSQLETGEHVSNLQLEYTEEEILTTHKVAEPLIAGGVLCHGGFDEAGNYI